MLAAVLETTSLERLYSALSVLTSTAAEGRPARALAAFGSLPLMLLESDELAARARDTAPVPRSGRERFARSLGELRELADELPELEVWACAAAVDLLGLEPARVERRLAGVVSMPRFLAGARDADLIFA